MARAANLTGVHIWAKELVDRSFRSGIYDMPVLLAAFSRNGVAMGGFGSKDQTVAAVITGAKDLSDNDIALVDGSTQRQIIFDTGELGGGKYLGTDGTTASMGASRSDDNWGSAYISWALHDQPIAIRNSTLRKAKGKFKRASVHEKSIQRAIRETNKQIATDLYTGNPTSQTAEDWDAPLGLQQWIRTTGTIGGWDRTNAGLDSALYNTSATNITLSTLDDTNIDGPVQKGGNIDLWIMPPTLYKKLKKEAQVSQQTIVVQNSAPEHGEIGFIKEFFMYNGMMVTFDPFCPASHLFGLDTSTWLFEVSPSDNWRVGAFNDIGEDGPPGSQDITASKIRVAYRLTCEEPWLNVQFTSAT